jgi:acetylornithine/succinyldiaminopimelate/putrescine aminotransferase
VFFCNSGAEANEAAIKVARKFGGHGRHLVVSAFQSFHGRTLATLHATGQPAKWETFQPLPEGFRHAVWDDLDDLERQLDASVAAVLLEPIQGEGGVNPATRAYFRGVRDLCTDRGILFMVDEVQTGLARTGKWFGFQHYDVMPDVVTMAKALGNGMPIGACWARREVAAVMQAGDHATTYGGQPLATAAARAVLDTMIAIDAPALAESAGAALRAALAPLPEVVEVRGHGLLLAAELRGVDARVVAARCLDAGLVLNGVSPTALRLAPALIVTNEHIAEAVAILRGVLDQLASEA